VKSRGLSPGGGIALGMLGGLFVAVLLGPFFWTSDPNQTLLTEKFTGPSLAAPLGRDEFGRDLLARLLHGGRLSLPAALLVLCGTSGIGLLVGAVSSSAGGTIDALLGRLVDSLLALPGLIVALALVGLLGKSFGNLLLALVLSGWPWYARVYRGLMLQERQQPYVLAARSLGAGPARVVVRHVLPNIVGPALVLATVNLGNALLSLTALSFLGLGAQAPQAEWGAMISGARAYFQTQPWVMVAPGVAIGATVLVVNMLGDELRDIADTRQQRP
jgi:peptide/nickel transport system permease protein